MRSGASVGANYRAACRGRSALEVMAKMGIVEEVADETLYWLDLLVAADIVPQKRLDALRRETSEILAMTVASIKTLRSNSRSARATTAAISSNSKSKIKRICL